MLRYPNITAGIALCISTHSEIELDLGILLSALLRAETNATLAIYSSLENRAAQMRMLYAAIRTAKISVTKKDIAEAILRYFVKPVTKERDRMAHWCWGWSPDIRNGLLLFEPVAELRQISEIWQKGKQAEIDSDHVFVVRENDIHSAMGRFEIAHSLLVRLIAILTKQAPVPPRKIRAAMLASLSSEPQLQQALSRLRESRKNDQSAPERSS